MVSPEIIGIAVLTSVGIGLLIHVLARHQARGDSLSRPTSGTGESDSTMLPAKRISPEATSETAISAHTVEELLERYASMLHEQGEFAAVAVWTQPIDPDETQKGERHPPGLEFDHGLRDLDREEIPRLQDLFAPWSDALEDGETVCIPDCASEPDLCGPIRLAAGTVVLCAFELSQSNRGVIAVAWREPRSVTENDLVRVRDLATQLGSRAEQLGLREENRYRRRQSRVLLQVAQVLTHARDQNATIRSILEVVQEELGFHNVAVLLVDEKQRELYVASHVGYHQDIDSLRLPISGNSVTATAARSRTVQYVPDVTKWDGYVKGCDSIRSELALPLLVEDELLGVLDVESKDPEAFRPGNRLLLDAVASEAALVLAHSRLLSGLEERASQLQAVDRLAKEIYRNIDSASMLRRVVEGVRRDVGCEFTAVFSLDPSRRKGRVIAASERVPDTLRYGNELEFGGDLSADYRSKQNLDPYSPDLPLEDTVLGSWAQGTRIHSAYQIPVLEECREPQVFLAGSTDAFAFDRKMRLRLDAMTPHISAALRNAALYEELQESYRKLNEAQDELVRAEQFRALGELTSGLAHKFNNLLGAILGRVQVACGREVGDALREDLEVIEESAREGAATIRQLQQFTGVHADRRFEPVDLSAVVRRVLASCPRPWRLGEAERDERYQVVLDLAEGAWVSGHPEELAEVVGHVVNNAIEAMPQGGTLRVRTSVADRRARVEVKDTGVGMSKESRARMFHPFFTTKGPRSLGLGLSIAFGIVQRHAGSLTVESGRDEGTQLEIVFPLGESAIDESGGAAPSESSKEGARIMIVEDEPAVADLIREILADAGHTPQVYGNATDAVADLMSGEFDLVLTDLGLPQMSGWELARHCRDLHSETPVVLVTGWGLEVEDRLIRESGVLDVVAKPFSVEQLLAAVDRALGRPSGSQAA